MKGTIENGTVYRSGDGWCVVSESITTPKGNTFDRRVMVSLRKGESVPAEGDIVTVTGDVSAALSKDGKYADLKMFDGTLGEAEEIPF